MFDIPKVHINVKKIKFIVMIKYFSFIPSLNLGIHAINIFTWYWFSMNGLYEDASYVKYRSFMPFFVPTFLVWVVHVGNYKSYQSIIFLICNPFTFHFYFYMYIQMFIYNF